MFSSFFFSIIVIQIYSLENFLKYKENSIQTQDILRSN